MEGIGITWAARARLASEAERLLTRAAGVGLEASRDEVASLTRLAAREGDGVRASDIDVVTKLARAMTYPELVGFSREAAAATRASDAMDRLAEEGGAPDNDAPRGFLRALRDGSAVYDARDGILLEPDYEGDDPSVDVWSVGTEELKGLVDALGPDRGFRDDEVTSEVPCAGTLFLSDEGEARALEAVARGLSRVSEQGGVVVSDRLGDLLRGAEAWDRRDVVRPYDPTQREMAMREELMAGCSLYSPKTKTLVVSGLDQSAPAVEVYQDMAEREVLHGLDALAEEEGEWYEWTQRDGAALMFVPDVLGTDADYVISASEIAADPSVLRPLVRQLADPEAAFVNDSAYVAGHDALAELSALVPGYDPVRGAEEASAEPARGDALSLSAGLYVMRTTGEDGQDMADVYDGLTPSRLAGAFKSAREAGRDLPGIDDLKSAGQASGAIGSVPLASPVMASLVARIEASPELAFVGEEGMADVARSLSKTLDVTREQSERFVTTLGIERADAPASVKPEVGDRQDARDAGTAAHSPVPDGHGPKDDVSAPRGDETTPTVTGPSDRQVPSKSRAATELPAEPKPEHGGSGPRAASVMGTRGPTGVMGHGPAGREEVGR